jgi:hypothetical protein
MRRQVGCRVARHPVRVLSSILRRCSPGKCQSAVVARRDYRQNQLSRHELIFGERVGRSFGASRSPDSLSLQATVMQLTAGLRLRLTGHRPLHGSRDAAAIRLKLGDRVNVAVLGKRASKERTPPWSFSPILPVSTSSSPISPKSSSGASPNRRDLFYSPRCSPRF